MKAYDDSVSDYLINVKGVGMAADSLCEPTDMQNYDIFAFILRFFAYLA